MKLKILLVILIFQFVFLFGVVSAEGGWCCLDDGCYDIPINEGGSCSEIKWSICDSVDECENGFCYHADEGICGEGVGLSECAENGGDWSEDENANCKKGCCQIGNSFSIETRTKCEEYAEGNSGIDINFEEGIIDQQTCSAQAESIDLGACVYLEGVERRCDFITQSECTNRHPEAEVYGRGMLCSNAELDTICERAEKTGCYEGNSLFGVYWYDSCGNRENIYEGEANPKKDLSWHGGFIKPLDESCSSGDVGKNSNCGNCDPIDGGTICGAYRPEDSAYSKNMVDYTCRDMNCYKAPINGYDDTKSDKILRDDKIHSETWCLFESFVGYGKDTVGSEHWIATCENGEVTFESSEYRENVCFEKDDEGKTTAWWEPNDVARCYDIQFVENNPEWEEKCEEEPLCALVAGVCTAAYPKSSGTFWMEEELTDGDVSEEQDTCGRAEGGRTSSLDERFLGGANTPNYANDMEVVKWNNYCISLGDCGTYINYRGDITGEGKGGSFYSSGTHKEWPETYGEDYLKYLPMGGYEANIFSKFQRQENDYRIDFSKPFEGQRMGPQKTCIEYHSCKNNCRSNAFCVGKSENQCIQECKNECEENYASSCESEVKKLRDGKNTMMKGSTVHFLCGKWQAPTSSENCELCNEDVLGRACSFYKCKSLGANCLFNSNSITSEDGEEPGESDEPFCYDDCDEDRGKIPEIKTEEIDEGFNIISNNEGTSATISSESGAPIPETTEINFKLNTPNRRATCRYTKNYLDNKFEDMPIEGIQKEGNSFTYNHSFLIEVPLSSAEANDDAEDIAFYIHCKDYCDNENKFDAYEIKLSTTKRPNANPPIIEIITPETEMGYIEFGETEKLIEIEADIPLSESGCKYDFFPNTLYADMSQSFNCEEADSFENVLCSKTITELTEPENNIYIRCENQFGFPNIYDFPYTFVQSPSELEISSIKLIKEGNVMEADGAFIKSLGELELQVVTSGGALGGVADCKYKFVNFDSSFDGLETDAGITHIKIITPPQGNHEIEIICTDDAENRVEKTINFEIDKDEEAPIVVRVFREEDSRQITFITNEEAQCYYNHLNTCFPFDFENNSTKITNGVDVQHSFRGEDSNTYYISCEDDYGNKNDGDCAVIIRPVFI